VVAGHVSLHPMHDGRQDLVRLVLQTPVVLNRKVQRNLSIRTL